MDPYLTFYTNRHSTIKLLAVLLTPKYGTVIRVSRDRPGNENRESGREIEKIVGSGRDSGRDGTKLLRANQGLIVTSASRLRRDVLGLASLALHPCTHLTPVYTQVVNRLTRLRVKKRPTGLAKFISTDQSLNKKLTISIGLYLTQQNLKFKIT